MSKPKTTKKKSTAKTRKPAATAAKTVDELQTKGPREELCVFAFRLTAEERDAIHKAAGPAKASKFVRTLAVAAARNDHEAVREIMKSIQA